MMIIIMMMIQRKKENLTVNVTLPPHTQTLLDSCHLSPWALDGRMPVSPCALVWGSIPAVWGPPVAWSDTPPPPRS